MHIVAGLLEFQAQKREFTPNSPFKNSNEHSPPPPVLSLMQKLSNGFNIEYAQLISAALDNKESIAV